MIATIIKTELDRGLSEPKAETLRAAALIVHEEYPEATAKDFAAAAASLGLHEGSARNRWNETKKMWGEDW